MAKKAMSNSKLKSLISEKKVLYNFKVTPTDLKEIEKNATKFAGGNVSAWIRHAAMNYVPKKSELANAE